MEPRSFDRGKACARADQCWRIVLQWSRDRLIAESVDEWRIDIVDKLASMEPRSFDRGKSDSESTYDLSEVASMEPRSFDRGKRPEVI